MTYLKEVLEQSIKVLCAMPVLQIIVDSANAAVHSDWTILHQEDMLELPILPSTLWSQDHQSSFG